MEKDLHKEKTLHRLGPAHNKADSIARIQPRSRNYINTFVRFYYIIICEVSGS
jgi:hypothetical protein